MRVKLIINDKEYLKAITEVIGANDKDICVEIENRRENMELDGESLIVTDISPERFGSGVLKNFSNRMIFLTDNPGDSVNSADADGLYRLFKYDSISSIIADMSQVNYVWRGETTSSQGLSRVFAVCSNCEDITASVCRALARQILFRHGGEILVISLRYINDYGTADESDRSRFSKLMYYTDSGRDFPADAFTYSDSYGIGYLRLPHGINPVAFLSIEELAALIRNMCRRKYETIVLDIGPVFSECNNRIINAADNIVFVNDDRNVFNIEEVLTDDSSSRLRKMQVVENGNRIELKIDDYVRDVYGVENDEAEEDEENTGSKKTQRANRQFGKKYKKMDY